MRSLDVVDGPARVVVGGITFYDIRLPSVGGEELVVVVVGCVGGMLRSVPDDLMIPITAEPRVAARMPFADVCRVIAVPPKDGGPERALRGIVVAAGILALHAHCLGPVRMEPGEHG